MSFIGKGPQMERNGKLANEHGRSVVRPAGAAMIDPLTLPDN
jgi:hypothetical protein